MTASIRVVTPGWLTTVQDHGRWGWQSCGVSVAGPMDPDAHRLANLMADNPADAATLEVTMSGPALRFDEERIVAVAGAKFELRVDNQLAAPDGVFNVPAGAELRFGKRVQGARAYVAVAGGVEVRKIFGSRATHLQSRMGGVEGRALRTGDVIPVGPVHARARRAERDRVRADSIVSVTPDGGTAVVRVLAGPHRDRFHHEALAALQAAPYVLRPESDRMGFRLAGPMLEPAPDVEPMISEATTIGMLQVPASGQPILLMADRQTTGGYPAIATVITADLGVAGQLAPGDRVRFVVCEEQEALSALIAAERRFLRWEASRRP